MTIILAIIIVIILARCMWVLCAAFHEIVISEGYEYMVYYRLKWNGNDKFDPVWVAIQFDFKVQQ